MLHVEKIRRGYLLTYGDGAREAFPTAADLFAELLLLLEGRCDRPEPAASHGASSPRG